MSPGRTDHWDGHDVAALRERWGVPLLEAYAAIASTNERARALVEEGGAAWSTVVADEQLRGRGRRGTTWVSLPGAGLWMTVVLDVESGSGTVPLEVGLACAGAIEEEAPGVHVGIKWPNDLMVEGAKVGGILCESVGSKVLAGIGINVAAAPAPSVVTDLGGMPAVALEAVGGKPLSRSDLAMRIIRALQRRFDGRRRSETGLDRAALEELHRRDVLVGGSVDTDQSGRGQAAGIDATGALRLIGADGVELRVVSGGVRPLADGVPDTPGP